MPVLDYQGQQLYYHQYGKGDHLVFAFHGFADNGDLFEQVALELADEWTVVALDLPFHGQSVWEGDLYQPSDIVSIVRILMQQFEAAHCSLLCHSMGGRIIWGVFPELSHCIDALYCFAPAGFQYTFTASRVGCPLWLRRLARKNLEEPDRIKHFFDLIYKLKLMNRATYLLFNQQIDLPRRRARLLRTWMSLYYFPAGMNRTLVQTLNNSKVPLYLFFGKKDRITPAKYTKKWLSKLQHAELTLFQGNHFFVRNEVAKPFGKWFRGQAGQTKKQG